MKNTPRIMTLAVMVVVICFALMQNQLIAPNAIVAPTGGDSIEQPAPDNPDDGEPGAVYLNGVDSEPETVEPTNVDPEQNEVDPADVSPDIGTGNLTNVDLGEDIELNEGITDKREEQYLAAQNVSVKRNGSYTSKVEVALYIHTYGTVPGNFISKTKARNAGWVSTKGNLDEVLPGKSIGGGGYFNESWDGEPLLPETPEGRNWHECDINYTGGYRGAERIVYSDDGLVFYTGDHYETFERLY